MPMKTNNNQLVNTCKDLRFNFWHYNEAIQSLPNISGVKGIAQLVLPTLGHLDLGFFIISLY